MQVDGLAYKVSITLALAGGNSGNPAPVSPLQMTVVDIQLQPEGHCPLAKLANMKENKIVALTNRDMISMLNEYPSLFVLKLSRPARLRSRAYHLPTQNQSTPAQSRVHAM